MTRLFVVVLAAVIGAGLAAPVAVAQGSDGMEIIDLSHGYGKETIYWPTAPSKFELQELARGQTEDGYFYSAYSFSTPEHGGTHIDAPVHFSSQGRSVDQLPLSDLVGPAVVIDISAKVAANADYLLSLEDVADFENQNGQIKAGAIILLRTDWSKRWPDTKAYLGDDTPGDASNLHFPSYGLEAARLLVEDRGAKVLGIDTASIDFGQSKDFAVHRFIAGHNVPGLENLANLDRLPATGATVIALPIKIEGGSGGPVRVIAILGHGE